jgi:hypothetical protein
MPPPYLFISFTALLLTPGTRKRPPQSGSVQTGLEEIGLQEALHHAKCPSSRLLAGMIEEPVAKLKSGSKAEMRFGIRLGNLAQKGNSR